MLRVALGTMRISGHFNGLMVLDRDTARAADIMRAASAARIDVFDTAPIYARGHAESDLGRLCPDSAVWTKVGVDVSKPLPTLDYTIPGMLAALTASCQRLRRASVDCAFVHNPPLNVLRGLDWRELRNVLVLGGHAVELGVSVLDPAEVQLLSAVPTPVPVMVEAAVLEWQPHLVEQLADAGHRLVLRSLFAGGRQLREVPPEHRAAAITRRLRDVVAAFNPWAVVIAPRTPAQLADYLDSIYQLSETVGRRP